MKRMVIACMVTAVGYCSLYAQAERDISINKHPKMTHLSDYKKSLSESLELKQTHPLSFRKRVSEYFYGTDFSFGVRDTSHRIILWKPYNIASIGVQTLTGVTSLGIIAVASISVANDYRFPENLGVLLIGSIVGALAMPTGVYFGGKWMGGNGGYFATVGGCLLGGLLMLPNGISGYGDNKVFWVFVGTLAGAIIGYNGSASIVYGPGMNATANVHPSEMALRSVHPKPYNQMQSNFELLSIAMEF